MKKYKQTSLFDKPKKYKGLSSILTRSGNIRNEYWLKDQALRMMEKYHFKYIKK